MLPKLLRASKKRLVTLCIAMAALLAAFMPVCRASGQGGLSAGLTSLAVEQVCAQMPYVTVYVHAGSDGGALPPDTGIEAYLDGKKLAYNGLQQAKSFGTSYIILLDVSGSIRPEYLAAAKEQIRALAGQLGREDSITLITFGQQVTMQVAGCTAAGALDAVLQPLAGADLYTRLYEAIGQGLEYARAAGNGARQVMLIVSDGFEDTGSVGITREEVEKQLEQANIPVYALCVDHAPEQAQQIFGAFARATGGTFACFGPQDAGPVWQALASHLNSSLRLCFEAGSNQADGQAHTLLLKVAGSAGQESYTSQVTLSSWVADTVPPTVAACEYLPAENTVQVQFSEPVVGADIPQNYQLVQKQRYYAPVSVSALAENSYCLALPPGLPAGTWQLSFGNIRDASMEANALEAATFTFRKAWAWQQWLPFLLGVAALAAVTALVLWRTRKKALAPSAAAAPPQQASSPPQPVPIRGGPAVAPGAPGHTRKARLVLAATQGSQAGSQLEIAVLQSSIWGRDAAMCDVCLQCSCTVRKQATENNR